MVAGTGTTEYLPAAQAVHAIVLDVLVQEPLLDVPAAHTVQLVHGEMPEALHVEAATQDCTARHESVGTSQ